MSGESLYCQLATLNGVTGALAPSARREVLADLSVLSCSKLQNVVLSVLITEKGALERK